MLGAPCKLGMVRGELIWISAERLQDLLNMLFRNDCRLLGLVVGDEDVFRTKTGAGEVDSDSCYRVSVALFRADFGKVIQKCSQRGVCLEISPFIRSQFGAFRVPIWLTRTPEALNLVTLISIENADWKVRSADYRNLVHRVRCLKNSP